VKFPIVEEIGNKLTALNGEVSSFYEVRAPDLDQERDLEVFYASIKRNLLNLKSEDAYKMYYLDRKIYLSTKALDFPVSKHILINHEKALSLFVATDFYSDFEFFEDFYISGGTYNRIFSVKDLPEEITPNRLMELGNFVICFRKVERKKARGLLDFRRRIHFSSMFQNLRNIDSENSFKDSEQLLENITRGEDSLFDVEIFFLVKGESKFSLEENTLDLVKNAESMDLTLRLETRALPYFFCNILPGVTPKFERKLPVPGGYLSKLLPLHRDSVMNEGIEFESTSGTRVIASNY
jgi:hypothetical protein